MLARGQPGVGASDTIGFETSDDRDDLQIHDSRLFGPRPDLHHHPRGWGGTQIAVDGTSILNGQDGYYNNRIVDDKLWQFHADVAKDFDTRLAAAAFGGVNYTNQSTDRSPDEFFVWHRANTDGTQHPRSGRILLGPANLTGSVSGR